MLPQLKSLFRGRFSLRELLLAITALCGLAAAFYSNRPFAPTDFLLQFRPLDGFVAKAEAANGHPISYSSTGGGASYDQRTATNEARFSLREKNPPVKELLDFLQDRVKKALAAPGFEILGTMSTDDSFSYHYKDGGTMGYVFAYGFQAEDCREIVYVAVEHR